MVSRRKILSRSRDELNNLNDFVEEEEDVWFQKDKLFKDHVQEVLDKWHQIDDEIWAKIICMERNRRVAKAYARAPVLTINGSDDGFDGFRIGLCGFENPLRDAKTEEVRKQVGNGVKIKMDDNGNVLIKKVSKANVYIKGTSTPENSIANEICKQKGQLEMEKPVKLFDMKKFQNNVNRELKQAYPERRKLESQCISTICFVRSESELLECPCWIMIINVVALDMLKTKIPPLSRKHSAPDLKIVNPRSASRVPQMIGNQYDEDPYSSTGSGGSGSSSSQEGYGTGSNGRSTSSSRDLKPPKLPPRDSPSPRDNKILKNGTKKPDKASSKYPHINNDISDSENIRRTSGQHLSSRKKMPHFHDDPYYCGMSARVPKFVKESSSNNAMKKSHSSSYLQKGHINSRVIVPPYDSGLDSDLTASSDDAYSALYGKMRTPMQSHQQLRRVSKGGYVGDWE